MSRFQVRDWLDAGSKAPKREALLLDAIAEAAKHEDTPDYLRAASTTPGFAPAALHTLHELEATGIAPERLESATDGTAAPGASRATGSTTGPGAGAAARPSR